MLEKGNPAPPIAQWGELCFVCQKYCVNSAEAKAKAESKPNCVFFSSVCASPATQEKPQQTTSKQGAHCGAQWAHWGTHTHTQTDTHTHTLREREREKAHTHSICQCLHCGQRKQSRSIIKVACPLFPLYPQSMRGLTPSPTFHCLRICISWSEGLTHGQGNCGRALGREQRQQGH